MNIHIITIFPESFDSFFSTSIISKANKNNLFWYKLYKLNDFSYNNTKRVDDKAYGMHWQVISTEPLSRAIEYIFDKVWKKIDVIFMSPKWDLLRQSSLEWYYKKFKDKDFIIICGHYEWIDQRIIDLYVTNQISIWDYILTSWELAAQVFLDWLLRHITWVLWNEKSLKEDSFSEKFKRKKEYPVYTRPSSFMWLDVPEILLSGNHKKIEEWKNNNLT